MAKQVKKNYSIMVKATLDFSIDVFADSLEDAVAQSKNIGIEEVEKSLPGSRGGYNDYKIDIQGVYRND